MAAGNQESDEETNMRKSEDSELATPITQMIDIVFLLIIFFVVTASVDKDLVDESIQLAQAKNTKPEEHLKANTVTINVRLENRDEWRAAKKAGKPLPRQKVSYNIALQTMSLSAIRENLKSAKQKLGNTMPILIRSDGDVYYRYIDEVIQKSVTQAGYSKITVVAEVPGN